MKLRIVRLLIGVTVGSGIVGGALWVLIKTVGDHESYFQGRPLSYWAEHSNSSDTAASNQVREVFVKEIIPQLSTVMFCDTNDSKLRLALVDMLNGLPGVFIRFTDADGRRARAAGNLGEFGSAGSAAIPVLLQAVNSNDPFVRGQALVALGNIHGQPEVVVPVLIKYLDDDHLNTPAAEGLGGFGVAAKSAVPKLVPLLQIRDKDLRHAVTESLKKIDPEAAAQAGIKIDR